MEKIWHFTQHFIWLCWFVSTCHDSFAYLLWSGIWYHCKYINWLWNKNLVPKKRSLSPGIMNDQSPKDSQNFTKIKFRLDMEIFKGDQIHISKYLYKPLDKLIITFTLFFSKLRNCKIWSKLECMRKIMRRDLGFHVAYSKPQPYIVFHICCKKSQTKVMLWNQGSIGHFPNF